MYQITAWYFIVMVNFNYQPDATYSDLKRQFQSACPWETMLIKLIDAERPSPLWKIPFPRQKVLKSVREEQSS